MDSAFATRRLTSPFSGLLRYCRILGFIAAVALSCVASRSDAEEPILQPSFRDSDDPESSVANELERLKQRIEELEKTKIVYEDATRTIIRKSLTERGSSINDFVEFGGTLETLASWEKDFAGVHTRDNKFDTADLDFKIKVSDWVLGSLVLSYDLGDEFIARTSRGRDVLVDRMTVREGLIALGNKERFPLFATAGRATVPFGISTGNPVTSALTIRNPLTIEVFETRKDSIMIGFEGPTPPPPPPLPITPVPFPPPVRPMLINPLVSKFSSRWLCSSVPCYPPPPRPVTQATPTTSWPPFSAAVYVYQDHMSGNNIEQMGATLGYQTKGYSRSWRTPWAVDSDVDFKSSVFDSNFLAFEYEPFLKEIGVVPGMAAHLKSNYGPVGLLVEWNGAIDDAIFTDQALVPELEAGSLTGKFVTGPGKALIIRPSTWQAQLAYQFDWNPSVEAIAAQGTYVVVNYSESEDMAGATQVIESKETRIGFVPKRRLSVGLGEWVVPGFRIAVEYSLNWDYSRAKGGTGKSGDGFFTNFTYEW